MKRRGRITDKMRLDWLEKAIQGRILLYDIWVRPSETPFKNLRGVIDAEIERILVGAAINREGK